MITIIAALTKERVIGKDNQLLWHLPEDLQNFKELTLGQIVIMGRKTYLSLPEKYRPLPHRHNIVISRNMPAEKGVDICLSIADALQKAYSYGKEIFVIGGATIYEQMLPYAQRMVLSYVKQDYNGDAYFPEFNLADWTEIQKKDYEQFEVKVYEKK